MKLCGVLLSNRRIKKHQNLNTNIGFFETMRFSVKFHDIYFVIFSLFIAKKLWSCGSNNTVQHLNKFKIMKEKIIACTVMIAG